jgi:hypothetical protein
MSAEASDTLTQDRQLEGALLHLILALHPDHLTADELTREMAADPGRGDEAHAIRQAIRRLHRSNLVREVGETVVPTHTALRFAELIP